MTERLIEQQARPSRRLGLAGAVLLFAGACTAPGQNTEQVTASSSTGTPARELLVWNGGVETAQIPFPGRVALPYDTCQVYNPQNPQPYYRSGEAGAKGELFVPAEGRQSIPAECDYTKDFVGLQELPTTASPGERIPAGTTLKVTGYAIGEVACNKGGTDPIWLRVTTGQKQPDGSEEVGYVARINTGFAPPDAALQAAGTPRMHQGEAYGSQGNC